MTSQLFYIIGPTASSMTGKQRKPTRFSPGLTMWTDGARLLDSGHSPNDWRGVKTHMVYKQEAYDTDCAALVRALNLAADRNSSGSRFS